MSSDQKVLTFLHRYEHISIFDGDKKVLPRGHEVWKTLIKELNLAYQPDTLFLKFKLNRNGLLSIAKEIFLNRDDSDHAKLCNPANQQTDVDNRDGGSLIKDHGDTVELVDKENVESFTVPSVFFAKFWSPNVPTLSKGWTNYMSKYFESVNDKCVLKFKYHALNYGNKRNIKFLPFVIGADCKMNDCFKFRIIIKDVIDEIRDYTAYLSISGTYNHAGDQTERRFITGEQRQMYADELKNKFATVLAGELLGKNDPKVLSSGNRNHAPSSMLLHKISSESKKEFDLDTNFHMFLCKLREQLLCNVELKGKYVSGFIQGYAIYPTFSVTLFTELQILTVIEASKSQPLCLYLDATGRIFAQPPDTDKRVYYYSLIIPGSEWRPPVAALEFITCGHSVRSIHYSLDIFVEALKKYSSKWPVVSIVETDFSKAMIQSACKAFNNMDLETYLNVTFQKLNDSNCYGISLTVLHVCSSHLIKASIERIKKFTTNKSLRYMLRSAVGLLVHATNIEKARSLFITFVKLFGYENESEDHNLILETFKDLKELDFTTDTGSFNNKDVSDLSANDFSSYETKKERSKFYHMFLNDYTVVMDKKDSRTVKNSLHVPTFLNYLLNELLPYYPLWSGVLIQQFGLRRNSNACVESWNKIIKVFLFEGKMKQLIPRAISQLLKNVKDRIRLREYDLRTSRQKRNSSKKLGKSTHKINFAIVEDLSDLDGFNSGLLVKGEKRSRDDANTQAKTLKKIKISNSNSASVVKVKNLCQKASAELSDNYTDLTDYDLCLEGWNRKSKSVVSNVGFHRFPKLVEEFNGQKVCFMQNQKRKSENRLCHPRPPPWANVSFDNIPDNYSMTESFYISGLLINKESLSTLKDDEEVDDNIINAFFKVSKYETAVKEPLIFDLFFFNWLAGNANYANGGFFRWAQKIKAWESNIWLLPKGGDGHWTLVVIVFQAKQIIFIDSLHNSLSVEVMRDLCSFIQAVFEKPDIPQFNWNEWVLYEPTDVPTQISVERGAGVNCGIHICVWCHIICSGSFFYFSENEMSQARKWIFMKIANAREYNIIDHTTYTTVERPTNYRKRNVQINKIRVSKDPPAKNMCTAEYCSLLIHTVS